MSSISARDFWGFWVAIIELVEAGRREFCICIYLCFSILGVGKKKGGVVFVGFITVSASGVLGFRRFWDLGNRWMGF